MVTSIWWTSQHWMLLNQQIEKRMFQDRHQIDGVVKNNCFKKALESLEEDFSPLYGSLKGTTAVMFSNTANAPAQSD